MLGERPFEGSDLYFNSLIKRFNEPIICCNMLRLDPARGETVLSDCFQECVRNFRKCSAELQLLNFDWHFNLKQLGPEDSLAGLFTKLGEPIRRIDVTCGEVVFENIDELNLISDEATIEPEVVVAEEINNTMFADAMDGADTVLHDDEDDVLDSIKVVEAIEHSRTIEFQDDSMGRDVVQQGLYRSARGTVTTILIHSQQRGVLRFNCADSLDRTNIATFFTSFQIVAEQLRRLGLAPVDSISSMAEQSAAPQWPFLNNPSIRTVCSYLGPGVLCSLAELYIQNGDVCSLLYTNSVASHSGGIRQYSPRLHAAPSDVKISLLRRFQNVVKDSVL